ncbi:hypothetical protein [Vibrio cholerae]|uniref:hypothetical protein n=1 Tax=Vibrio cholerae TaxID=666 RepID=UPI0013B3B438|nr:hypothetical protein [Vibrio cholerae]
MKFSGSALLPLNAALSAKDIMVQVYNFKPKQPVSWYRKSLAKSNQRCLYCNEVIGLKSNVDSNKEHLIARDFVPSGCLSDTTFNFIFRACVVCNNKKSNFERHISSVSLFNSSARTYDRDIDVQAIHKASNDYHPDKKGHLVKDSSSSFDLAVQSNMSVGLIAPPQMNRDYVKSLALMHIQGFFSLITTVNPLCENAISTLEPGRFWLLGHYPEQDWGNPQIIEIIKRTKNWDCFCNVVTADGYFKVIIKKSSVKNDFFWALEWNKHTRVVGAISNIESPPEEFLNLPKIVGFSWRDNAGNMYKVAKQTKLECEDELFIGELPEFCT